VGVHLNLYKVRVEGSIVNTPRIQITDQLFKSNLTYCVVCIFTVQTDEWYVHDRLFKANFEDKRAAVDKVDKEKIFECMSERGRRERERERGISEWLVQKIEEI
jgi:hypothetical protein